MNPRKWRPDKPSGYRSIAMYVTPKTPKEKQQEKEAAKKREAREELERLFQAKTT